VKAVVNATWDKYRYTVGASADDAGVGNLDVRRVIAVNPGGWPGDLEAFFEEHYPGVEYIPVEAGSPEILRDVLDEDSRPGLLLNQGNEPWGSVRYAEGRCPIIGNKGCWITCCAMAQRFYGIDPRATPLTVDAAVGPGGYNNACEMLWSAMERLGLQVIKRTTNEDEVRAHLAGGDVVFAEVLPTEFLHFVMVTRCEGGRYWMLDPWKNVEGWLDDYYSAAESWRLIAPVAPKPSVVGVHGSPITLAPPRDRWDFWVEEMRTMGIEWYKSLCTDGDWLTFLVNAGITPIVRFYQENQFPGRLDGALVNAMPRVGGAGVTYVEIANEPNLDCEWKPEFREQLTWQNQGLVEQVANDWWEDAKMTLSKGLKPAFPAMAPTDRGGTNQRYSSVVWVTLLLSFLKGYAGSTLVNHLRSGDIWVAVHTSPFDRSFNFDPDRGDFYDDMCLRGFQVVRLKFQEILDVTPATIISTEGGCYSPEHLVDLGWTPYSEEEWAKRQVAMFDWLETDGTLKAMCPWILTDQGASDERWKDNGWFRGESPRPVVAAMKARNLL